MNQPRASLGVTWARAAQEGFDLAPHLFDGVEVRGVGGQEEGLGTCGGEEGERRLAFVRGELVHEHEVAGAQRREAPEKISRVDHRHQTIAKVVLVPRHDPVRTTRARRCDLQGILKIRQPHRACIPGLSVSSRGHMRPSEDSIHFDESRRLRPSAPEQIIGGRKSVPRDEQFRAQFLAPHNRRIALIRLARTIQQHIQQDVPIEQDLHHSLRFHTILRRVVRHPRIVHRFAGRKPHTLLRLPRPIARAPLPNQRAILCRHRTAQKARIQMPIQFPLLRRRQRGMAFSISASVLITTMHAPPGGVNATAAPRYRRASTSGTRCSGRALSFSVLKSAKAPPRRCLSFWIGPLNLDTHRSTDSPPAVVFVCKHQSPRDR